MGKRTNTAVWLDTQKRWQIKVQKDNDRRTFTSGKPGRTGQREANTKADLWLDDNVCGRVTVTALHEKWLEEIKATTGTSNYRTNKSYFKTWVIPEIGKKYIDNVTEQNLQDIINDAFVAGRSKKMLKDIRCSIRQFIKFARKCGTTKLFPENLKIPKSAPEGIKRILLANEFYMVFTAPIDTVYICGFKFLAVTGLRRGELLAIQTDRDVIDNVLYIRESYNENKEITNGKNDNAVRSIAINNIIGEIIETQLKFLKAENIKSKYLFPDVYGNIQNAKTFYDRWCSFCKKNNIQKISLHELRHTFISLCKTVPQELLKEFVGHSEDMDTFGQYGHDVEGEQIETSRIVEENILKYLALK